MPLVLLRIDERLLHGQVLVGWGARLDLAFYVVVDDALAESAWEQEIYVAGLPEGVEAVFLGRRAAAEAFGGLDERPDPGALLTRDTGTMRFLAERGLLRGRPVNVGGIHAAPGRRRALDYVYLGREETRDLEAIERLAGRVTARDLPGARRVPLGRLARSVREAP